MITLKSYVAGEWKDGTGRPRVLRHAVTGEEIAQLGSEGVDFAAMLAYGRDKGGPALRQMTFPGTRCNPQEDGRGAQRAP